jgi:hypothetical protein
LALQDGVANGVVSGLNLFRVAASIDLHDETTAETDEVEVIAPERRLPAEVKVDAA